MPAAMSNLKTGAIHIPAPTHVPLLAARVRLDLMTAPASCDWHAKCPPDHNALGNDTAGCCVEVADYRVIQMRRANAWGDTWAPTMDMVIGRYATETGYNPVTGQSDMGTPTDQDMTAWCTRGIRLDDQNLDVPHWATIDPQNLEHVRLAVAHAGPVLLTLNLPTGAQSLDWSQVPGTGSEWLPGSWGAHRIMTGKYDGSEFTGRTWGIDLPMHPEFWAAYVVAVDVALSPEWLTATGLTPSGMDLDALMADRARLAS